MSAIPPSQQFVDAKARVLTILKQAAPQKVSTWDLIHQAQHSRAAGRVWELIHDDGYRIEHTQNGRIHYWRFVGNPTAKQATLFDAVQA